MVQILILGLMLSGYAVASDQDKTAADSGKAKELHQECEKQGGVFSQVDNDMIRAYTCRTMKGDLVGVYMPEQAVILEAGDSDMFEKAMKWGKKI